MAGRRIRGQALDRLALYARLAQATNLEHAPALEELRRSLSALAATRRPPRLTRWRRFRQAVAARRAEHEQARYEADALRTELETTRSSLAALRVDNSRQRDAIRRIGDDRRLDEDGAPRRSSTARCMPDCAGV